jgi:tetratricopeptide (TPR) repeat protein
MRLGWVHFWLGDLPPTLDLTAQGLALHREINDDAGIAAGLHGMAWAKLQQGKYREARQLFEEAVERRRAAGDMSRLAFSLANLGVTLYRQGDVDGGWSTAQEALAVSRSAGAKQAAVQTVFCLADCVRNEVDVCDVIPLLDECLDYVRNFGRPGIVRTGRAQGKLARCRGDLDQAERHYRESVHASRAVKDQWHLADGLVQMARIACERGDSGYAATLFHESLELNPRMDNQQGLVDCFEGLAAVAVDRDEPARAARLFGCADRVRDEIGAPVEWWQKEGYVRVRNAARGCLGERAFQDAISEGRNMEVQAGVQLGLAVR